MSSINACFFLGNLTRDPDLKFTPKGTAVAEIGLAVNKVWIGEDGHKNEEVTFLNLTAWGKTAEIAEKYLRKGDQAHFQCEAKLEQWDDKQTGAKRSAIKFRVEKLTLLSGNKRREESQEEEPPPRRPPPQKRKQQPPRDPDLDGPEGDDIPFRSNLGLAFLFTHRIRSWYAKAMLQMRSYATSFGVL